MEGPKVLSCLPGATKTLMNSCAPKLLPRQPRISFAWGVYARHGGSTGARFSVGLLLVLHCGRSIVAMSSWEHYGSHPCGRQERGSQHFGCTHLPGVWATNRHRQVMMTARRAPNNPLRSQLTFAAKCRIRVSICLPACLSIYPSMHLSIYLSVHVSIHLSIYGCLLLSSIP